MSSSRVLRVWFASLFFFVVPVIASAATTEIRILFDVDNDATTGCTAGGMQGVEHVLVTQVSEGVDSMSVAQTHRLECTGGSLGSPTAVTGGWAAGWAVSENLLTVETRAPFSIAGEVRPTDLRIGIDATRNGFTHSALVQQDGSPIMVPPPPTRRRRSVGAPGPDRTIIMDGALLDWGTIKPILSGVASGGSPAVRIHDVFFYPDPQDDYMYFAIAAKVESSDPFADNDTYFRDPGTPVTVNAPGVLGNDGDPNGQPLTATKVSEPSKGTVTLNPDGSFTYSPDQPDQNATDQFEYRATNGTKDSNVATVRIKVDQGSAPKAPVDDFYTTEEDKNLFIAPPGVLDNDPKEEKLKAKLVSGPSHGQVSLNENGGFTYMPNNHFFGTDTFVYTVEKDNSPSAGSPSTNAVSGNATVTITITSVNDAPKVKAETFVLAENSPNGTVVGTVEFTDADAADNHECDITAGNTGGAFAINEDTCVITVANQSAVDFETNPTFSLSVRVRDDGDPARSDTGTITINLTDQNDPPILNTGGTLGPAYTENDPPTVINGTITVVDPESSSITGATIVISGNFAAGQDVLAFTPVGAITGVFSGNTLTLSGSDSAANYQTALRSVTYQNTSDNPATATRTISWTVTDSAGPSNTVTSSVTLIAVNDAPVNAVPGAQSTNEDTPLTFSAGNGNAITINDVDGSSSVVTLTVANGTVTASPGAGITNNGTASVQLSGSNADINTSLEGLVFTPSANFNGVGAQITVTTNDQGNTGTGGAQSDVDVVTITVNAVNDPPTFNLGGNQTVNEDAGLQTVNGFASSISVGPANEGAQTITSFNVTNDNNALFSQQPAIDTAGNLTYQSAANANGSATVSVTATDSGGATSSPAQTFVITVNAVNDEPTFNITDPAASNEDGGLQTVNGLATAISTGPADESGQTVSFSLTPNGTTGDLSFASGPSIDPSGNLTYTANANTNGTATFNVVLTDNGSNVAPNDNTSPTLSITITVNAVNDPPTFNLGGNQSVNEDAGLQTVNGFASSISVGPANESAQTITSFNVTNDNNALFSQQPAIDNAGNLTYQTAGNANGSATVSVSATDSGGATSSPAQTFLITVNAVNDEPTFNITDPAASNEDAGLQTVNGLATAISAGPADEAGQTLTFTLTPNGSTGTLTFSQQPAIDSSGNLTYTATADTNGTATFNVVLTDSGSNIAPNDNTSPTLSITITVNPVNDPPSFSLGGNQSVNEDSGLQTVNGFASSIALGPSDESGQTITSFNVSNDNNALFSQQPAIDNAGNLTYQSAADANGMATVSVTATDSGGATSSPAQTFIITINAINDEPTFNITDPAASNEDGGLQTVNGLATAISAGPADEAGQTLTFTLTPNGTTGDLAFSSGPAIDSSGNLTYTATANTNGTATFNVVLTDSGSNIAPNDNTSATLSITITVNAVNDPPSFNLGGNQSVNEDSGLQTVNGFASSISVGPANEGAQTITSFNVTNDNNSLFSQQPAIDNAGNLTYQSAADANGSATVSVTATDSGGATSSPAQTFLITINAVNDQPTFNITDPAASNEDGGLQTVNGLATAISAGPADEAGQTLTFSLTPNGSTGTLTFSQQPAIDSSGNLTYTATADTNGTATFNVVLTDSGSNIAPNDNTSATLSITITVNAVNDPPSFTLGADQTVNEDAGLQTENGFVSSIVLGPPDESGQTITSFNVTNDNNSLFSQQPAIDNAGNLTYQTAADANGSATVSVTATDSGGATSSPAQTFTITVDPINDEPTFNITDPAASNEDAGLQTVNGLATAISAGPADEAGQTLTFSLTPNGTTGNLTFSTGPSIDSSGNLTYTATADTSGTATFDVVLTDSGSNVSPNDNTSATLSITITVNDVNDPPTFNLGGDQTVDEDAGLQTVNGFASSISVGPASESGQTITSFNVTNDNNSLFSQQPAIDTSGNLTYQAAGNANGSATVSVTATDSGGATSSPAQTFLITVNAVNDEPTFNITDPAASNEDGGLQTVNGLATAVSAGPADEAGQTLTFSLTPNGSTGTLTFSQQPAIDSSGNLTYTATANTNGTATFNVVLTDSGSNVAPNDNTSATLSITITVNAVNDKPVVTLSGTTNTFTEGSGPVVVDGGMTVSDIDTTTLTEATLTITNLLDPGMEILAMPANVFGITANYVAPTLTLTHATGASLADFQTVLQSVTYENTSTDPDAAQRNIDIQINDGQGVNNLSDVVTKNLNIVSINSKPVVTPSGGTTAFIEDSGAVEVDSTVTVTDSDTPTLVEATVTISNLLDSGAEFLAAPTLVGGITANYVAPTLTLTHATGGLLADFQTVLQNVTYNNTSHDPTSTTRVIEFQLDDGQSVDNISDVATKNVSVTPINDAPAGTDNTVTTDEEVAYTFTVADFGFSDPLETPDDNFLAVKIASLPGAGSLTLSGNPVVLNQFIPVANITAGNLVFTPAANGNGSPYTTFTFQVQDDGGTASGGVDLDPSANTMTINVNNVNDAPAGTDTAVGAFEDTLYTFTVANFGFTDPNDTPANTLQSVIITTLPAAGSLTLSGGGFAAGTEIAVADITAGNLKFLGAANANGSPYTTFTFQVRDNGGVLNGGVDLDPSANTMTINVTGVNDAPAGTDTTVTGDEDVLYTFTAANFGFTDPNDSPANTLQSVIITTLPGAGSLTLSGGGFAAGTEISLANITAGNLKFLGALNAFGSPYTTFTFQVRDNGGVLNGGVDLDASANTMTINLNPVNDAPTVVNESFDVLGNTELRVDMTAGTTPHTTETTANVPPTTYEGVIDNDSDIEGDTIKVTAIGPCTVADPTAPFDCTLTSGAVVHVDENGEFSFTPGPGDTTDTFTYTVTDVPSFGSPASTVGTVTLNFQQMVWYVKQGSAGNGTSISPFGNFDSLDGAGGAGDSDDADDYLFVHNSGSLALSASVPLETNQHVLGEAVGLSIPVNLNGNGSPTNLVTASGTPPALTLAAGDVFTITNAVPVEIRGLALTSTAGNVVALDSSGALTGSSTLTVADNTVNGAGAEGIDIAMNAGTTGTLALNITNNTWNTGGTHTGNAIDVVRTAGTLNLNVSNNTNVLSTGSAGINVNGAITITGFDSNTVHGNTAGQGIVINNATLDANAAAGYQTVTGGTTLVGAPGNAVGTSGFTLTNVGGDISFSDLDIYAGNGSGFTLTGTGAVATGAGTGTRVTVTAGQGTFEATGGPAVNVSNATVDLQLASLVSSNTTTTGVSLTTVSDGTTAAMFSATSGSITTTAGATGPAFNVSGGNAGISFGGTITNNGTAARAVSVSSWAGDDAGDNMVFSGAIDENGAGILLNTNSGSRSINFSGNMDIDTTTGEGFAATSNTNSLGLNITGTNDITSVSATALRITSTTIGASDVTFRNISSGNATAAADPANGIVLNTTGALGSLIVTGTGGAGTGGTIQNTTGDAISLTSTDSPSFSSMNITTTGGQGINASTMTNGFTVSGCAVSNTGDGDNEHAVRMLDISGTVSVQGTTFNNTAEDFFNIDSSANTSQMILNVGTTSLCTFTQPNTLAGIRAGGAFAGNGILVTQRGAKNYTINVEDSTFTDIKLFGIQVGTSGTSTANNVNVNLDNNDFLVTITNALGNTNNRANAINIQSLNTVDIDASITNNLLDGGGGGGIQFGADNSSSIHANVTGNTVTDQFSHGIIGAVDENATMTLLIDSNIISNTSANGIWVFNNIAAGGTSTLNATITNNNVSNHSTNVAANADLGGIVVFGGADAADVTFYDINGNSVSGNPAPGTRIDYWVDGSSFGDAVTLEGPGVAAVAEADFLAAPAPANTTTAPVGGRTFIGNTFYSNGATCPLPVLTP